MITIEIDKQYKKAVPDKELRSLVQTVFKLEDMPDNSSISIRISSNAVIQQLNAQYLDIDAPTDVLSFPFNFDDPESETHYYGDIIVSYEKAAMQAEAGGHAPIDEIKLLVIHGILHLLGYDHATPEEKQEMWAIQTKLLTELKINASPTE